MGKRSKKKSLVMVICAAVLLVGSLGATLAYLTDTASVTNTFTVGNVDIKIDETLVNEDGKPVDENGDLVEEGNEVRVEPSDDWEGNEYHLLPGEKYLKDPMVTVNAGSEESYVRMILTVTNASAVQTIITNNGLTDYADLFEGWNEEVWLYHGFEQDEENNTISFEFRYHETVDGFDVDDDGNEIEKEVALSPLFTHIVVPGTASVEELAALYGENGDFTIQVEGHAIQAVGFEDDESSTAVDKAWAAFDVQLEKDARVNGETTP